MLTIKMLQDELMERIDGSINEFKLRIAVEFASAIEYGEKTKISHSRDPSWDCSGISYRTWEGFSIEDYELLKDFFDELTGVTEATFLSGLGFSHQTYEECFEDIIRDEIGAIVSECYEQRYKIEKEQLVEVLGVYSDDEWECSEMYNEVVFFDLDIYEREYLEKFSNLTAKEMYELGIFSARRRRELQKEEAKAYWEKEALLNEKAELLLDTFTTKYEEYFNAEFDSSIKIEKPHYNKIKKFLNENFTKEERSLLPRKLYTSNSVRDLFKM